MRMCAAKGACTSTLQRGTEGSGIRGVQSRDVEDGAMQQVARDWRVPLRRPVPICSRYQRVASGNQTPEVQDGDLQDGFSRRHVSLRPSLPFPPLPHRAREVNAPALIPLPSPNERTAMNMIVSKT